MNIDRIYCENCLDTMARMPNGFVDLVVTSPPYDNLRKYNGYTFDFETIARELYRVTKVGGVAVWVVGDATVNGSETLTSFKQAIYFRDVCGFNVETMIWNKPAVGACGSNYFYWQAFEYMFLFVKGAPKSHNRIADRVNKSAGKTRIYSPNGFRGDREGVVIKDFGVRSNVWDVNVGISDKSDRTEHPAPFPEQLANDHIISWSNEGDLVYDPFMGSGTTAKMSLLNNRHYIGSEISAEYCEIAYQRIQAAQDEVRKRYEAPK